MNPDFPRIITMLRKERGISQKNAASELGISQALLSHYEKGIRECGLDFLVKAADYYKVSCDYLLGRSAEPEGKTVYRTADESRVSELAGAEANTGEKTTSVVNSVRLLLTIIQKSGNTVLLEEASKFLMLAVYRLFRIVFSSNSGNNPNFFTVKGISANSLAQAAMLSTEASAVEAAGENGPIISATALSDEYPEYAPSLLNAVKRSEDKIRSAQNALS